MSDRRPSLPALLGLSPKQLQFAELLSMGVSAPEAAARVGYAIESAGQLMAHTAVQAYVKHVSRGILNSKLVPISTRTLEHVLKDENAPASARVAAVRLVWTAAGLLEPDRAIPEAAPPTARGEAPPSARADVELAQLRDRLEGLRQWLRSAAPIDVAPVAASPLD